ncbi:MAG: ribosomal protein S18-alanine N-acetyltransferase [Deltaproteobacteria bacterium]|nr:ribosomal protein S18-alanine N-acetyltransferase [Deltaproteobacteria bacterium]
MTPVAPFAIEPMRDDDLDAAITIDLEAFTPGELGAAHDEPRSVRERSLREELVRAWARLRVARSESGAVLGYSLYWHVVDEIHLLNVAVAIPARRRGIGRALVAELIAHGKSHGATRVLLEVRASNEAAIAMYEALGFERFNVRARYYADGEDAVEMSLAIG